MFWSQKTLYNSRNNRPVGINIRDMKSLGKVGSIPAEKIVNVDRHMNSKNNQPICT